MNVPYHRTARRMDDFELYGQSLPLHYYWKFVVREIIQREKLKGRPLSKKELTKVLDDADVLHALQNLSFRKQTDVARLTSAITKMRL